MDSDQHVEGRDWSALLRRHEPPLRSRVRRVLRKSGLRACEELVEEVVQEVYCRLLESDASRLRRCRGGTDRAVTAYLGIIAERVVLDLIRQAGARKRNGLIVLRTGGMSRRTLRALERLTDPRPDPEEAAARRERERLFLDCCRELRGAGPGRRNAWVMRLALLEGYSSREIAEAARGRLTARSVDNLVHRLRRHLARSGFEVPRRC
jgi:RNA polymerase sigma factor (sigma-70 family)